MQESKPIGCLGFVQAVGGLAWLYTISLTLECRFRLGFTDFLFARFRVPNENAPRHEQMCR